MNYYDKLFVNAICHEVFHDNYFAYTIEQTIFIRIAMQTTNTDDYCVVKV